MAHAAVTARRRATNDPREPILSGHSSVGTSVTAIVLMIPGAGMLLLLERFLKSEYLVFFGQL